MKKEQHNPIGADRTVPKFRVDIINVTLSPQQ
jgi:hypothetical protein